MRAGRFQTVAVNNPDISAQGALNKYYFLHALHNKLLRIVPVAVPAFAAGS